MMTVHESRICLPPPPSPVTTQDPCLMLARQHPLHPQYATHAICHTHIQICDICYYCACQPVMHLHQHVHDAHPVMFTQEAAMPCIGHWHIIHSPNAFSMRYGYHINDRISISPVSHLSGDSADLNVCMQMVIACCMYSSSITHEVRGMS